MNVKSLAIGLAMFLAYSLVVKAAVVPLAKQFGVPLVKDL